MKKHRILLNMINNFITFFLRYYIYFDILLSLTFPKLKETKIIPEAKYKNIVQNQILKRRSNKNLDNFLRTTQKLSDKKQRLINASKQKLNMSKQKPKIFVINFLDNLDKENLIV